MSGQLYRCASCHAVCAPGDMLANSDLSLSAPSKCPGCGKNPVWNKVEVTLVQDEAVTPGVFSDLVTPPPVPAGVLAQTAMLARLPGYTEPDTSFRAEGQQLPQAVFAPTWDEFQRDCVKLADKLRDAPITTILVVLRGGAVPGAILSELLNVRDVRTCAFRSYGKDHKRSALYCTDRGHMDYLAGTTQRGQGVLLIDDLVDTGATMAYLCNELPGAVSAAVYAKPKGVRFAHVTGRPVAQNIWVKFPWEIG